MGRLFMVVGFFIGCAFSVAVWFCLRNYVYSKKARLFLVTPPFIAAAGLAVIFLAASVIIDNIYVKNVDYGSFLIDPKTWVLVFKEFFFASVIAIFFMTTIELYSRSEQDNFFETATTEAQKNVFQAVYQNSIDPLIFEEAEESIFQCDFVRTNHSRDIQLQKLPESADYLLLRSTQEFRVRNVAKSTREYDPVVYLPKSMTRFQQHVKVARVTLYQVKSGQRSELIYEHTDAADIAKALKPDSGSPSEICYRFPTASVDPSEEIEVQYELMLVKEKFDNEIWTTLIPTLKAEVTVQSEIEGLELTAIAHHRGTMMPSSQGNGKSRKKWTVERPLLPFQGYVVSWSEEE